MGNLVDFYEVFCFRISSIFNIINLMWIFLQWINHSNLINKIDYRTYNKYGREWGKTTKYALKHCTSEREILERF